MKRILITGSTDGIGLATANLLLEQGHQVILHGRNKEKLNKVKTVLSEKFNKEIDGFIGDLSGLYQVKKLADAIKSKYAHLDVLINNAGVYVVKNSKTVDNLEVRFVVNTLAPYLLTKCLLPYVDRVVNLSSAAQSTFHFDSISNFNMADDLAYAESKLGLTMWSFHLGQALKEETMIVAVNPKSFLGSKMVKEAYGSEGHNINIGADILSRAALSDEFASAHGQYFDNDLGRFSNPHPDAMNVKKRRQLVDEMDQILNRLNIEF